MSLIRTLKAAASPKAIGVFTGAAAIALVAHFKPGVQDAPPANAPEQLTAEQMQKVIPLRQEQLPQGIEALKVNKVPAEVAQTFASEFATRAMRSTTETQRLSVVSAEGVSLTACLHPKSSTATNKFSNLDSIQISTLNTTRTFGEKLQRSGVFFETTKADPCEGLAPHNDAKITIDRDGNQKFETAKPAPISKATKAAAAAPASKPLASQPYAADPEYLAIEEAKKAGFPSPNYFPSTAPELAKQLQRVGLEEVNATLFSKTAATKEGVAIQRLQQEGFAHIKPVTAFARLNNGTAQAVCVQSDGPNKKIVETYKAIGEVNGKAYWVASAGQRQLERINATYGQSCEQWLSNGQVLPTLTVQSKTIKPISKGLGS